MALKSKQRKANFDKAGFIIYGKNSEGRVCVLMSYSQGRFDPNPHDKTKYYAMTKGSIDPGEEPIVAAARETWEETGISVEKILGKNAFKRFVAGEVVQEASPVYPKVKVKEADPTKFVDYSYVSVSGKPQQVRLYRIEVENIDRLMPYLKRPPHIEEEAIYSDIKLRASSMPDKNASKHTLEHGIGDYVKKQHYPSFDQLLEMLRSGEVPHIPGSDWAPEHHVLFSNPSLPQLEAKYHVTIRTPHELSKFFHDTLEAKGDFAEFRSDLKKLKSYFNKIDLTGDLLSVKLDDKDFPLSFYFEGGEILPLDQAVKRSIVAAEKNPIYARAQWGIRHGQDVDEGIKKQFEGAQISGMAAVFSSIYGTGMGSAVKGIRGLNNTKLGNELAKLFAKQASMDGKG